MHKRHAFRPRLEALESRWVPATIRVVGGSLFVSAQAGTLVVTPSNMTPGVVTISDAGRVATVSGVGGLISIVGSNKNDAITFNGNAVGFKGNLLINAGNGNDLISVTGIMPGNVSVLTGLGNDKLNLAGKIGGNLNTVNQLGQDATKVTANLTVGGNAALSGTAQVLLNTGSMTVGGSLSITANQLTGVALEVSGEQSLSVGKSLTVVGANGADSFGPFFKLAVAGDAVFNLGEGNNSLDLTLALPSTIGGQLLFNGCAGIDTVNLLNLEIAGNATLNTGDGSNNLEGLDNHFSVAGSLSINQGNGNNGAFTIQGKVAGDMSIVQGNGQNGQVTVDFSPDGKMNYKGGNGSVSLELGGGMVGQVFRVHLFFGTGTNVLTLTNGDIVTDSNTIEGSGGNNTFNQNGAMLIDITFIDFP